ncbi:MAG: TolC family protein [Candidatus Sulfopaludibacter sp.]|nr:TolC family protein [Candidatus Sulfopaludibacter sp.]
MTWRRYRARSLAILFAGLLPAGVFAQTSYTWQQIKDKFEATNPTLKAARDSINESRVSEITAYLRPNPDFSFSTDGTQISRYEGVWRPFAGTQYTTGVSYLHERDHKRELRLGAAKQSTTVAESSYTDQERSLLFNLRSGFVQVLQSKAVLENAKENLGYWDRELGVNRRRFSAGDLALVDLNRLELQRVQFEADFETAMVNLRTAKIQLLTLLNARTPIEQFDVTGPYDFDERLVPLEEFRNRALAARPDLKAAIESVELAKINRQLAVANGSTDPTFSAWWSHNPSFNNPYDNNTLGASVTVPLRIFDRNQGEKARTQIDIGRNERLREATQAQVLSDVDSAYWTLVQALNLLRPYKAKYLPLATDVRDKTTFSYQHGGASLLDFLDAEKAYRDTRLAYLTLIGSYLTAAAQMNMAAGQEVLP